MQDCDLGDNGIAAVARMLTGCQYLGVLRLEVRCLSVEPIDIGHVEPPSLTRVECNTAQQYHGCWLYLGGAFDRQLPNVAYRHSERTSCSYNY